MTEQTQAHIQQKIAQIIENSRHQEEMFLLDSKGAATEIIRFLKQENLISSFSEEMFRTLQN